MNGKVYEVVGGSAALLCWRNGVKEREKVAELPLGLDELWGGEEWRELTRAELYGRCHQIGGIVVAESGWR